MAAELDGVEVRTKWEGAGVGGVDGQGEMARQGGGAKEGGRSGERRRQWWRPRLSGSRRPDGLYP